MKKTATTIIKSVMWLEMVLAVCIIVSVVISSFDLLRSLYYVVIIDSSLSYDFFQKFLAHALLLVIGLELSMMLIRHTPGSVIEVMLFAVARKMLIYTTQTYEIAIGVLALAGLFAIRKYLFVPQIEHRENPILAASTPVKTTNRMTNLHIPEELGSTLEEIVHTITADRPIKAGDVFAISDAQIEVVATKDGLPDRVKISELSHE